MNWMPISRKFEDDPALWRYNEGGQALIKEMTDFSKSGLCLATFSMRFFGNKEKTVIIAQFTPMREAD